MLVKCRISTHASSSSSSIEGLPLRCLHCTMNPTPSLPAIQDEITLQGIPIYPSIARTMRYDRRLKRGDPWKRSNCRATTSTLARIGPILAWVLPWQEQSLILKQVHRQQPPCRLRMRRNIMLRYSIRQHRLILLLFLIIIITITMLAFLLLNFLPEAQGVITTQSLAMVVCPLPFSLDSTVQ